MNLCGAIFLAPTFPVARQVVGLSEPEPFYLWVLSSWILAFGVAYLWQGWTGRFDRGVIALGAFGKLTFGTFLLTRRNEGQLQIASLAGALPDILLAIVFCVWLYLNSVRGARRLD